MKSFLKIFFIFLLPVLVNRLAYSRVDVDLQLSFNDPVYQGVKHPDDGSRLEVSEANSGLGFRLSTSFDVADYFGVRLGWVPLGVPSTEKYEENVTFGDKTFLAGQAIDTKFESDRYFLVGTYAMEDWWDGEVKPKVGLGVAYANVSETLRTSTAKASFSEVEFGPLLFFRADWILSERFFGRVELDAVPYQSGRCLDGALAIIYESYFWNMGLGYRVIENYLQSESNFSQNRVDQISALFGFWY